MSERRRHLQAAVRTELEDRDASAVVHAGTGHEPTLRYCLGAIAEDSTPIESSEVEPTVPGDVRAVALDAGSVLECGSTSTSDDPSHPADRLATRLADRGIDGPLLTPPHVPHDAALYLEEAGFSLSSTTVLERARAVKTDGERERIADAQAAASAGVRRGASILESAAVVDGRLAVDGDPLSAADLRRRVDAAIVAAGAFPAGNTTVTVGSRSSEEALRPSEPIAIATAPRGPRGYHGGLARTVVVDGGGDGEISGVGGSDEGGTDDGWERRARVALTRAFKSARALLAAGDETVGAVEADLEAEIRAFGFEDGVRTAVAGVGLEAAERPRNSGTEIGPDAVVRIEAEIAGEGGGAVRLADLLVGAGTDPRWLEAPARSLEPAALADA